MLKNNSIKRRKEFRSGQRVVEEAVQAAKEKWILQVASEGGIADKDGHVRWNCIRKPQVTHDKLSMLPHTKPLNGSQQILYMFK